MMTWLKRYARSGIVTLIIVFAAANILLFPIVPVSDKNIVQNWLMPPAHAGIIRNLLERTGLYTPPQKGTAPTGRRSGGAGRGPICAVLADDLGSNELKALIPYKRDDAQASTLENQTSSVNSDPELVGGLTITGQPTFWFYVPYVASPNEASSQLRVAQFVLVDAADETAQPILNELVAFDLSDSPRLVEYQPPYTLEPERLYKWYFSVICDAEKLSRNPVVRGWVQRVEEPANLQIELSNVAGFDRYGVYAENGIWFEAVTALVNARRQFTSIDREDWSSLLAYFGISDTYQLGLLEPTAPTVREVVNGNQLPARM